MYLGKDRKTNRWQGYDYSLPGLYFITICTKDRKEYFGQIADGKMILSNPGQIVKKQWLWLAENFKYIKLNEFVVMPNHLHGIIEVINENYFQNDKILENACTVGNVLERSLPNPGTTKILPLYRVIGAFKTTSGKLINRWIKDINFKWQKSFHDRVIRNENELINIREYIVNNPANWQNDRNNILIINHVQTTENNILRIETLNFNY